MILVTGGAFQGKFDFVKDKLNIRDGWIDGDTCSYREIFDCTGVKHFHRYVKRALEDQVDLGPLVSQLAERNPGICIITNELGSGVVPVEQFNRAYRDELGRLCSEIAQEADDVYRVICGIGVIIKRGGKPIAAE